MAPSDSDSWCARLAAAARDPDDHLGRDLEADGALLEFMDDLVAALPEVDYRRSEVLRALARLLDEDVP